MAADFDFDALRKRLDAIVVLLMEPAPAGTEPVASKIERLLDLGFTSSEVAKMLGTTINYVNAAKSRAKKRAPQSTVAAA